MTRFGRRKGGLVGTTTRSAFGSGCSEAVDRSSPSSAVGLRYLLDVRLAREAIEVWQAWRPGQTPSLEDKLQALTFYAEHDAWLPVE